jgi:hypothetical protein
VVIGYRPAQPGYLPCWSVRALPGLEPIGRPPLDRSALPTGELTVDQEAKPAVLRRDAQERRLLS